MKNSICVLLPILSLLFLNGYSQSSRDDINGDWTAQEVTLYNTPEAAVMVRAGDIDNLGFGWPTNFDPFSGASTPAHAFPFSPDSADVDGTDRIMVITSYNGSPPHGQDGYTNGTSRPENLPRPITLSYDLGGVTVNSAMLQIFVDDFQASTWGAEYFVTLNQVQAPYLASQVNSLNQTGPIGKLINVAIPPEHLSLVSSGSLSLLFDDLTTGAGDGYAIDFVKLLINPTQFTFTGTIIGTVTEAGTGNFISGALVSASGLVESTTNPTGNYTLSNVPAGLINVTVSAAGYETHSGFVDLQFGQTVTYNVELDVAVIPECDTLHYPFPGTPTLYFVTPPEKGYVCGNNSYGDKAKADYFEPAGTGKYLNKGFFEFAYVSKASGQNPDVEFRVWDNSGANGYPGAVKGVATVPLNDIYDDVVAQRMTEAVFDPPVEITGPFYLGLILPVTAGDTLALICTLDGEVNPGTAFEMWSDNSWFDFSENGSWGLKVTQAIYAQYCDMGFGVNEIGSTPMITVYPNPAHEIIHIDMDYHGPVTITLASYLGQVAASWTVNYADGPLTLPLGRQSPGLYMLTITGNDFRSSYKVILQ